MRRAWSRWSAAGQGGEQYLEDALLIQHFAFQGFALASQQAPPGDFGGKRSSSRCQRAKSPTHNLLSGSQPEGWPTITCPSYQAGKRARPIYLSGQPNGTQGRWRVARRFPKIAPCSLNRSLPYPQGSQLILQPSCWGVTRPVFHFHTSMSSCRPKATIACLRRRTCTRPLSKTPRHFLTSQ